MRTLMRTLVRSRRRTGRGRSAGGARENGCGEGLGYPARLEQ